jgi:hypothetical protein
LAICGFDSLSCHLDLFERVVFLTAVCKAVAINCEAVGERFDSFTTQFSQAWQVSDWLS